MERRGADPRTRIREIPQLLRTRLRDSIDSAARFTPARLALAVVTALIGVFTVLLSLPIATTSGHRVPFVDALFTTVSAITVTGLVTVDTGETWSTFGLVVIMITIKVGGLGVLTLASLLGLSVTRRMGLAQRIITASETRTERLAEVGGVLRTILITSTTFEALTFIALVPYMFIHEHDLGQSLFLGLFYAISAFNNAGFVPEAAGTAQYVGDPFFSIPIATAVFTGALGFPAILVMVRKWRTPRKWSVHAKLTVCTSAILLVAGWIGIGLMEWTNPATLGDQPLSTKLLASGFAAVMPRSGGFSTLDVAAMTPETRLLTDLLMFIGGGSGSTGGGIKVTTFALLTLSIVAEVRGDQDVEVFHRRIPHETIRQAIGVLALSSAVVLTATLLMLRLSPFSLDECLFEVLSGFGTVGLTTGITSDLPTPAKYVIIAAMYVGRIGPMSLGAALALRETKRVVRLPLERPIVG